MSEIGETFAALKEHRKAKKLKNQECSTGMLKKLGINIESKNNGNHLIIPARAGKIDFWPSTGKWICRSTGRSSRGIKRLMIYIANNKQNKR